MKIILLFFQIYRTFDITLYPPLGVAIENRDNAIIVTNGYIRTNLRIEMQLPGIDKNVSDGSCTAKNDENFSTLVDAATNFKAQIKIELDEFIDTQVNINQNVEPTVDQNEELTIEAIKANPLLCNRDEVSCKYFPVVDLNPENNQELKLRACYNSELDHSPAKSCAIEGATTICCSKKASKNEGICLTKNMDRVMV